MAQLSRPFQVLLVVFAVLAAVWFIALRGHSAGTSGASAPTATAHTPRPAAHSAKNAESGAIYHGPAPGVEGLSRDIAKAHGAAGASQQNAQRQEAAAARAEGGTASGAASTGASTSASPAASPSPSATAKSPAAAGSAASGASRSTTAPAGTSGAVAPAKHSSPGAPGSKPASGSLANQRLVEQELGKGKVVLLLFWSPSGADDILVRGEVQRIAASSSARIAVHYASASQVSSYGSITRGVQVYGTPTLVIIDGRGHAVTLTGFTDAYAIEQAIDEARHL